MDIKEKLHKANLLWNTLPTDYYNAPYVGNGSIGTIFWQDKNSLSFEMGRCDYIDHRNENYPLLYKENRLKTGNFTLSLDGIDLSGTLELDLYQALVKGVLKTEQSRADLRVFNCDDRDIIVIEVEKKSGKCDIDLIYNPYVCESPRLSQHPFAEYVPYPPANFSLIDGVCVCVQSLPEGELYSTQGKGEGQFVVAWKKQEDGNTIRFYITMKFSYPQKTAIEDALCEIKNAVGTDIDTLFEYHLSFWRDYYSSLCFIDIPDDRIRNYYYLQCYRFASATRPDTTPVDLLGPWYKSTGFPAIWWNMNEQIAYSLTSFANHPEYVNAVIDLLYKNRETLSKNTETGIPDAYCLDRASSLTLAEKTTNKNEVGNLAYMLYYLWENYRTIMDDNLLKDKLLPLMKGALKFLITRTFKGDDGKLHFLPSGSPEFTEKVEDCSYTISAAKWLAKTIISCCQRLGVEDNYTDVCYDFLENVTDYPIDEKTGFMIGKDMPLDTFHTHWSHMFMIYPYGEYDFMGEERKELIETSFQNWVEKQESKFYVGFCSAGAISMHSLRHDGNNALLRLNYYFNNKDCYFNGMYTDTYFSNTFLPPVFETPIGIMRGLFDMLMCSNNGIIDVLPAIPDIWNELSFERMRTQGAFLTSLVYQNGKISYFEIESLAGEPCIVEYEKLAHLKCNAQVKMIDESKAEVLIGKGQRAVFRL